MKLFNITAQVYKNNDLNKQTIFMNKTILALYESDAKTAFNKQLEYEYNIIKIYSIEDVTCYE